MALERLPWDMEEEILSRLPALSLVRFRAVCKHWNALFNDKWFVNNNLARARPQFMLLSGSKKIIYSIDIDLDGTIELHEVPCDIHCEHPRYSTIMACDGLLFRDFWKQGVAVLNPWLRQVGWIEFEYENKAFNICGVGYDASTPEKSYKILGSFHRMRKVSVACQEGYDEYAVYECASHAFKFIDDPNWPIHIRFGEYVSFNGNLYWPAYNQETQEYFLGSFDFSMEISKPFCLLPCRKKVSSLERNLVLTVFKGDRFALLDQRVRTRKIKIWVTKTKIKNHNNNNKDDYTECVVWLNFMTLSIPNLPRIIELSCSYFICDKTLIMCCDVGIPRVACIFIARGDMCKKIQIDSEFDYFSHCVYLPNLISVPFEFSTTRLDL